MGMRVSPGLALELRTVGTLSAGPGRELRTVGTFLPEMGRGVRAGWLRTGAGDGAGDAGPPRR